MKTLSFHNFNIGRKAHKLLLRLDAQAWGPGLHVIVAPNGYGKTTLLQTIAGALPPLQGEVKVDGAKLDPERDVLYVSEYLTFPKFIYPSEWIEFMSGGQSSKDESEWIRAFRLEDRMGEYVGRLSQGERRKVTWIGAHVSPKPILLLDEPLDGLDLLAIRSAREMVADWKRRGRCVGVVAHQVGEVLDLADEVWLIKDQKLVAWNDVMPQSFVDSGPEIFRKSVLEFYTVTDTNLVTK